MDVSVSITTEVLGNLAKKNMALLALLPLRKGLGTKLLTNKRIIRYLRVCLINYCQLEGQRVS